MALQIFHTREIQDVATASGGFDAGVFEIGPPELQIGVFRRDADEAVEVSDGCRLVLIDELQKSLEDGVCLASRRNDDVVELVNTAAAVLTLTTVTIPIP